MDAVTEDGKREVTEKVKDILPTHSALAPHVPTSSATSASKRRFVAAILCPGLCSWSIVF